MNRKKVRKLCDLIVENKNKQKNNCKFLQLFFLYDKMYLLLGNKPRKNKNKFIF
jgi:hypothetical protein